MSRPRERRNACIYETRCQWSLSHSSWRGKLIRSNRQLNHVLTGFAVCTYVNSQLVASVFANNSLDGRIRSRGIFVTYASLLHVFAILASNVVPYERLGLLVCNRIWKLFLENKDDCWWSSSWSCIDKLKIKSVISESAYKPTLAIVPVYKLRLGRMVKSNRIDRSFR